MSQPPPWPPEPLRSVNGGLIMALGIMGLLICNVFGPFAAVMGGNAVSAIDRGEAKPNERGSANAGRIMGIISTVFLILSVLLVVVAVANPQFRQGFSQGFEKSYHGGSSAGP